VGSIKLHRQRTMEATRGNGYAPAWGSLVMMAHREDLGYQTFLTSSKNVSALALGLRNKLAEVHNGYNAILHIQKHFHASKEYHSYDTEYCMHRCRLNGKYPSTHSTIGGSKSIILPRYNFAPDSTIIRTICL